MIKAAGGVHIADSVMTYIVGLITATRVSPGFGSARAPVVDWPPDGHCAGSCGVARPALRHAEDVAALIQPVLAHRLVLTPEAIAGGSTAEQGARRGHPRVPVPKPDRGNDRGAAGRPAPATRNRIPSGRSPAGPKAAHQRATPAGSGLPSSDTRRSWRWQWHHCCWSPSVCSWWAGDRAATCDGRSNLPADPRRDPQLH